MLPSHLASWRALRTVLIGGALVLACGLDAPAGLGANAPIRAPLLIGGDISALARLEQAGATYREGGIPSSAITVLRAYGANVFRLRLFLAPNGTEVQVNDLPYTIALAKRVRASGARLLLDFHYSDTWADPGNQQTPAAWAGLGIDSLEARVESYTRQVLDTLRAEGVLPSIVQIGNEIDAGLLWPVGRIGGPADNDSTSFADFGRLLKAGVRGVRTATTSADSVRILLHYSNGANLAGTRWFFDLVQSQNIAYDLIGLSYYPFWHGRAQQLRENLTATAARYGKDIVIVETGYPWREDWQPAGTIADLWEWPRTAAGQRAFLRDVFAAVDAVPDGRGKGVLWWYPESINVPGLAVWGGGSLALFNPSGEMLPAVDVFRTANTGR